MNKNTLLAGLLSFIVIFTWFQLTNKNQQKKQTIQTPTKTAISQGEPESKLINVGEKPISEHTFELENDTSKIIIGSKGEFKSFILKEQKNNLTELVYSAKAFPLTANPTIIYNKKALTQNGKSITLTGSIEDKIKVKTTYEYLDNKGLLGVTIKLTNNTNSTINVSNFKIGLGPGLNTSEKVKMKQIVRDMKGYYLSNDKLYKKPKIGSYANISNSWIAVGNHYFISAIIDTNNIFDTVQVENRKIPEIFYTTNIQLAPNETKKIEFQTLWGLKEYNYLKSMDNEIQKTISLGLFAPLGKLIMWLLHKFYSMTHNYGIAIILLTTLMQLILLPLNKKSYESMHKLKKVQPKLEQLKKKHKDNPQHLNMEMMALYKREKVNPFGGCLPILLQLPIFLALFNTLRNATELRYAPFMLWITDLSRPDTIATIFGIPINILPILMGAMMFISQRLNTGKTDDPMQSKMLTFMPIIFLFMFWNFPAGLVLYWLFSNIYTVCLNLYLTLKNQEA